MTKEKWRSDWDWDDPPARFVLMASLVLNSLFLVGFVALCFYLLHLGGC